MEHTITIVQQQHLSNRMCVCVRALVRWMVHFQRLGYANHGQVALNKSSLDMEIE